MAVGARGVSKGTVTSVGDGFVVVNGTRFNTSNATVTMDDPADTGPLKPGMIVTVTGTADGTAGTAANIVTDTALRGPVARFDNLSSSMTVLGQKVKLDPAKTVFANFSGAAATPLSPGQMVQVSGFTDSAGAIEATRIERKTPDWTPSTVVLIKGAIGSIPDATTFTIGGLTVAHAAVPLPAGAVVGSRVKVQGTLPAVDATTLTATSIEVGQDNLQGADGGPAKVEGLVTDLSGNTFKVGGLPVDAGTLSLAGIAENSLVQVSGTLRNGVLTASEIKVVETSPPSAAPAAPTGVAAVGGAGRVTISWDTVNGATSYNIYQSTTPGVTTANGTKIANVTSPHVQTGLTSGTTYFFVVTAVNGAGESPASSEVSAAPSAAGPDGQALYAANCAGCHGALASSNVRKRSATQIHNAIATVPAMGSLSSLTPQQVAAIAAALNF